MEEKNKNHKSCRVAAATYEKQIYDLKQLLEISKSLCSVLEFSTLIESILYICMCQMRVLSAGIFIAQSFDSEDFELHNYHNGFDPDLSITYTIPANHSIITYLNDNDQPLTFKELKKAIGNDANIPQISSLNPSLIVPLKQKNRLIGILLLGERIDLGDGVTFSKYDKEQISSIASLAAIAINNAALVEMTTTDMMTRLKLKTYFYTILADKIDTSVSEKIPLAVLMLDIDHFKNFNDTYGHACGDYVLQEVSRLISEGVRNHDLAARYGGEEFVVMLYNSDAESAMMVAERIRKNIEECDFVYEGLHMTVTISIGISTLASDSYVKPKELVDKADQALYISKNNGRNRSTLAT